MQLGLRGDGIVVTGRSKVLKLLELPSIAIEHEEMCAARAYIMQLIVGVFMLDNMSNRVHLKYLPLLKDFSRAGTYSWGSAVLAIFYRELCQATKHWVSNMAGCLGLLWATFSGIGASQTLIIYSQMIKASAREKILYSAPNIATLIPQWIHAEAHVWCINTLVLNFSTIELYNADRVMRQFRCTQFLPVDPQQFANVHVPDHNYRRGSQPMGELDLKDQHMVEPESEDQFLNTSDQWVGAFCDGSQNSSYHPEKPPISFDMFVNNMYYTLPQATFNPAVDPLDVYSTP
ncbi:hypothetical protein Gotur_023370 [Gossypium turneri]